MREAVIVSAARTPIGRAFRGAFNQTHGATMAGHVVEHAMERAGVDPAEVEDVVIGSGLPEGATGNNIGRAAALRAGCPVTVSGTTINRYLRLGSRCDRGGGEARHRRRRETSSSPAASSRSRWCRTIMNMQNFTEEWLLRHAPDVYMPML